MLRRMAGALGFIVLLAGCQGKPAIQVSARYATAAAVVDGTVYISGGVERTGGKDATVGTMEAYDPAARRWTSRAPMPTPRAFAAAAAIFGKVFVFGGLGADGKPVAAVEAFDPAENRWYPCAPLPTALGRLSAAPWDPRAPDAAFVGGGLDVGERNSSSLWGYKNDRWFEHADLPEARHGLGLLHDVDTHLLFAIGGYGDAGPSGRTDQFVGSMDDYRWRPGPPLAVPRGFFGLATVGRRAYAVGGRCKEIPPTEVLDLDRVDAGWTRAAPLPKDLCRFSMVEWNGHLLAFGGETQFGASVNTEVLEYDPAADRWTVR